MTAETESLALEILKRIQADIAELKDRMTGVEIGLSAMDQQLADLTAAFAELAAGRKVLRMTSHVD